MKESHYKRKLEQEALAVKKMKLCEMTKISALLQKQQILKKTESNHKMIIFKLQQDNQVIKCENTILKDQNADLIDQKELLQKYVRQLEILHQKDKEHISYLNTLIQKNMKLKEQSRIISQRNVQIENKLLKFQTQRHQKNQELEQKTKQINQLKQIIQTLFESIEKKNKNLERFDFQLQKNIKQLLNSLPRDRNDSIESIKNAIKFMSQEVRKKSKYFHEMSQKFYTFEQYQKANHKVINQLRNQNQLQYQKIQALTKQNECLQKLQSERKRICLVEQQMQKLKNDFIEVFLHNQACHIILVKYLGHNIFNEVQDKKKIIKQKFNIKQNKQDYQIYNNCLEAQEFRFMKMETMQELQEKAEQTV